MNDEISDSLATASREWRNGLIDVGGSNRLLYYRNTAATLVLDDCPPRVLARFLGGETVRLSELYPSALDLERAQKACAALARKQREAVEEYGISVTSLAAGLASWDPEGNPDLVEAEIEEDETTAEVPRKKPTYTRPRSPVLLRSVEIELRRGAQQSWDLRLNDDFALNGVMMHVLNADRERLSDDLLADMDDDSPDSIRDAYADVEYACDDVADFSIEPTLLVGAFSYVKQPMVDDISDVDALAESDLVAALAGDAAAAERIRSVSDGVTDELPDLVPVDAEYLVLDADSSQSYVVNAALAGRNLVVQGPPGTGKSQTIANIIATSAAYGRKVLFVAQKRAAVSAVLDRLEKVDLGHVVLDLFAAASSRRFIAEQLQEALDRQATAGQANTQELHFTLGSTRDRLVRHNRAMHLPTRGWGLSVSQLLARAAGQPDGVTSATRLDVPTLNQWSESDAIQARAAVVELARLGAFDADWNVAGGWAPEHITTAEILRATQELLGELSRDLTPRLTATTDVLTSANLPPLQSFQDLEVAGGFMERVERVAGMVPQAVEQDITLDDLRQALTIVDRAYRKSSGMRLASSQKKSARELVRKLVGHLARRDRGSTLRAVVELREQWPAGTPSRPDEGWAQIWTQAGLFRDGLSRLSTYLIDTDLVTSPTTGLVEKLRGLAADRRRAAMPQVAAMKGSLEGRGVEPLLQELADRMDVSHQGTELAGWIFDAAVTSTLLDEALFFDPELSTVSGADLDQAARDFQRADLDHLEANAVRVRRRVAEALKVALDEHQDQHLLLRKEVTRRARFTPVRRLVRDLGDVMLSAKPVWAMSPLQVSRLLPRQQIFDVVVFDEASQVKPADAIPAILRGRQLIVAGDSRQLPPTEFFTKTLGDDDDADDRDEDLGFEATLPSAQPSRKLGSFTRDAESILFAVDRLLAGQSRSLLWHYRSRDERLIAPSNRFVYSNSLTTFPSADTPDAITHTQVAYSPGINGGTNSPDAEVAEVVAAVKRHASEHPDESIGVIAFGIKHQRRLELALDAEFAADPNLLETLNSKEPFFVKSIERVQGDERDAILLTVGYGRGQDGVLRLFWGPLLQAGGERRLNVAISRARLRLTLISSFGPDDLAADGHDSPGYKLMYQFVRFVASRGAELGDGPNNGVALNPFEIDIRDRLQEAGLHLDAQVGVGSYRIDFAVRHPVMPGRHILAIEADGAAYHSGHIARERDRLRQQLLERRGWTFHRIWSTDWFNDADAEVQQVLRAVEQALERNSKATSEPVADVPGAWELPIGERTLPKPRFYPYASIDDYTDSTLRDVVAWVRSDAVVRSADDELSVVMEALGFQRRGVKIVRRIRAAQIAASRI
ncbi:AAA domain-containing protein [Schumannella soli]|uniref:AAA family ATPase n=1 Tax=Schumannella soli TaxID=2590779 RepID=A0A506Y407_9MICO|nr:AAA domain-containing protein [Schumannella soli]TPW76157.1 AAA family ATPase [Schumannella soli]